jgi:hypothetical protein
MAAIAQVDAAQVRRPAQIGRRDRLCTPRILQGLRPFRKGHSTVTLNVKSRLSAPIYLAPLTEGRHGAGAAVIGEALYLPAGGPVNGGSKQSDSLFIFTDRAGS